MAQFLGLGGKLLSPASPLDIWRLGCRPGMANGALDVGTFHVGVLVATAAAMGSWFLLAVFLLRPAARVNPIEALRDE